MILDRSRLDAIRAEMHHWGIAGWEASVLKAIDRGDIGAQRFNRDTEPTWGLDISKVTMAMLDDRVRAELTASAIAHLDGIVAMCQRNGMLTYDIRNGWCITIRDAVDRVIAKLDAKPVTAEKEI